MTKKDIMQRLYDVREAILALPSDRSYCMGYAFASLQWLGYESRNLYPELRESFYVAQNLVDYVCEDDEELYYDVLKEFFGYHYIGYYPSGEFSLDLKPF